MNIDIFTQALDQAGLSELNEFVPPQASLYLYLGVTMALVVALTYIIYWLKAFCLMICCKKRVKMSRNMFHLLTFGIFACTAAAGYFFYACYFNSGYATETVEESESHILYHLANIYSDLSLAMQNVQSEGAYNALDNATGTIQSAMDSVRDVYSIMSEYLVYRDYLMEGLLLASASVFLLGLLGSASHSTKVASVVSFIGPLILIVSWLSFAIYAPTHSIINEVCVHHESFLANYNEESVPIRIVADCIVRKEFSVQTFDLISPDQTLDEIKADIKDQIVELNSRLDAGTEPIDPEIVDGLDINYTSGVKATITLIKSEIKRMRLLVADMDEGTAKEQATATLDSATMYVNDYIVTLPAVNCNRFLEFYEDVIVQETCESINGNLASIALSLLVVSVSMTVFVLLTVEQRRGIESLSEGVEQVEESKQYKSKATVPSKGGDFTAKVC